MRKTLFAVFAGWALAGAARGQDDLFQNDGIINYLTNIDAITFVNNGVFQQPVIGVITNVNLPLTVITLFNPSIVAYDFSDVQNFTNNNLIATDTGIKFDTAPSQFGNRHMAASFFNGNNGQVFAGSAINPFFTGVTIVIISSGGGSTAPRMTVSATNVVNTGLLDTGVNGVISVAAATADLRFGTLHLEGLDDLGGTLANIGIFNRDWGLGLQSNALSAANFTPPLFNSPISNVTNSQGAATLQQLLLLNGSAFANVNIISPSNMTFQAVFVLDTSGKIATDVRFAPSGGNYAIPIVQWSGVATNSFTGQPITNTLYLEDEFGALTNFQLVTNALSIAGTPLPQPFNYLFTRTLVGYNTLPAGNTPYNVALFNSGFNTNGNAGTNQYTAYGVQVAPQTSIPDSTAPLSSVTNLGGRIEIQANEVNLAGATITGPNYLRLTATNQFDGSTNAQLIYPVGDISLHSTNGSLNLAGVVAPNVPRMNGPIDMYSTRWTNVTMGTNIVNTTNGLVTNTYPITNGYHVLMVLSDLSASSPVYIKDLSLGSYSNASPTGNLVINDLVNVTNTLFIDAQSLTIASNAPGFPTPTGQLNVISPAIIWSSSLTTNLHNVTNWGTITASNTVFFQKRLSPNFPSPGDGPYSNFVNHSTVFTAGGSTIWAGYVENTGPGGGGGAAITSGVGPISIQFGTALLTNGALSAPSGSISLLGGSATISNQSLQTSGLITLGATNLLTDGVTALNRFGLNVTNVPTNAIASNVWAAGNGLSLLSSPGNGDLLGTTVTLTAPASPPVNNTWAAADRGVQAGGFANNTGLGHLRLNGSSNTSVFHFSAASPAVTNALYVDLLELQNGATNRVANVFTALNIDTNMTIYFASAVIGNLDISEKLNGANGGRILWVSNYAGLYSSTNVTYPDGRTFAYNRPLRTSLTIDSDGDGIVNGVDPTPFPEPPPTPSSIGLTITVTNQSALISWQVQPGSTNYLYTRTLVNTNWQVLTNFVQGPAYGRVTVTNTAQTNRLYKVRVDPAH